MEQQKSTPLGGESKDRLGYILGIFPDGANRYKKEVRFRMIVDRIVVDGGEKNTCLIINDLLGIISNAEKLVELNYKPFVVIDDSEA